MSRVIQVIIDEAMKLESDLTTANECLDDVIAQREECKQQLALTIGDLRDAQNALEGASSAYELQKLASHEFQAENTKLNAKIADQLEMIKSLQLDLQRPQQDLQQYLDQIHNLNKENKQQRLEIGRLNDKINTPRAPGSWNNRMVLLAGYGTVLAIHLYEQGWPEAAISGLVCPAPMLIPTYSEWYMKYGQANGWMPPEPPPPMPGLPSAPPVVLSDDQSHWVAIPDVADEAEAVEPPEVAEVPESLQSFRQRNRAKPTHDE